MKNCVRLGKWKPCLIDTCTTLVLTAGGRKRCDPCQKVKWAEDSKAQRKKKGLPPLPDVPESSFLIEARFQQALKEVQSRRGEREILIGWASPLSRIR